MLYVNPLSLGAGSGFQGAPQEVRDKLALQELERLLLFKMLQEMRKTVPKGTLLGDSKRESFFQEMLDDVVAGEMAKGGHFGVAKQMEAQQDVLKQQAQYRERLALAKLGGNRSTMEPLPDKAFGPSAR